MSVTEKFLHYVSFDTQSDPESTTAPSTEKQLVLAKELEKECKALGFQKVMVDPHGIVYATLEATDDRLPSFGFCAHMDTATELSGKDIRPRIIENYDGSMIVLNDQYQMDCKKYPALSNCIGDDLIVTDGNTLLGGDDKAGIAIIMQAVDEMIKENLPHGKIIVAFTPDEEVGRGTENFDLEQFQVEFAYTVDGGRIDALDYENFNAAQAKITITGNTIHPGYAKDKMINACLLAHELIEAFPKQETPAHTENREGFYHLLEMEGTCESASLAYIIRDHDFEKFTARKQFVQDVINSLNQKYGDRFQLEMQDQYYNMVQFMHGDMRSVTRAKEALAACGLDPVSIPTRGGTDGAMLTEKGCICPNFGTGSYNHHGRYEFCSINQMETMVQVLKRLMQKP